MSDNILKTQRSFARKATTTPDHRFDDLYHLLKREDWIDVALDAVLRNTGSRTGGIDGVTRRHFLRKGFRETFIDELKAELATKNYQPQPVRRQYIPKANGKTRPLGIPTIRDRVVQMLLKMMLEPIFESDFLDSSYGFRPEQRTMDAIGKVYSMVTTRSRYYWVIEGDIRSYFDNVNHAILLKLLAKRIADRHVLNLIGRFLKAGVMEGQIFTRTTEGTPQGGILSPLLANCYLHELDRYIAEQYGDLRSWERRHRRVNGQGNAIYMRYADDWIILWNGTKAQADAVRAEIQTFLRDTLKLELSEEKTLLTHVTDGFTFLGFHIQHYTATQRQRAVTLIRPSDKSIERLKDKIREITARSSVDNPKDKLVALNAILRGWMHYYRHVSASQIASWLDNWVYQRVSTWLVRRHNTSHREILKRYKQQETPTRKNLAARRADGSYVYLFLLRDIKITRYRRRKHANPYLREDPPNTTATTADEPLPEAMWDGKTAGASWHNLKDEVAERDGYCCVDCGAQANLDGHHLKPRVRGGRDELSNVVLLCKQCHVARGGYGRAALKV
jgi:group II intron reverse transcriptase/maturase